MRLGVMGLVLALWGGSQAIAGDPASCQEQLLVKTVHTQFLHEQRTAVEQQLAQASAFNSVLQQKLKQVMAEHEALKAKLKEAAPREP